MKQSLSNLIVPWKLLSRAQTMHDLSDLLCPLAVEGSGTEDLRIATKIHMCLVVLSSLQLMRALKIRVTK